MTDPVEIDDTTEVDAYHEVLAQMAAEVGTAPLERIAEVVRAYVYADDVRALALPGMASKPWWEPAEVEDAVILEQSAPVIREELDGLLKQRAGFQHYDEGPGGFEAYHTNFGWNVFYLRWGCQSVTDNQALCPRTSAILNSLPNLAYSGFFSALNAGSTLEAHNGSMNVLVTVHLGLVIPKGCTFRVGTESRFWEEGKCLVFQDCFEHEALNPTESTRFIFLIDTWHPEVKPIERRFLEHWCQQIEVLAAQRGIPTNLTRHRAKLDGVTWWQK